MPGSFFGLNISISGLNSAQRQLDTISHNIDNVNTLGYSRQIGIQTAATPLNMYDGTGMIGTGTNISGIERLRDSYLDYKYWGENSYLGEWTTKNTNMTELQTIFNEPSDTGFSTVMSDFYDSIQELTKDPSNLSLRSVVKEKAVTMTQYFSSMASHLKKMQEDLNYNMKTKVEEINSLATQITQLNKQIYTAELGGNAANDLRDQRTVLVDKLSGLVNIQASEVVVGKTLAGTDDKHFVISIGGKNLVDHFECTSLELVQRKDILNEGDLGNLYDVRWSDSNELNIESGELKGILDVRDGNGGLNGSPNYKGIPYYTGKLNEFVRTFAKSFNEGILGGVDGTGQVDGYGLDPDGDGPETAQTGIRFFTMLGNDGNPMDSASFMAQGATIDDVYSHMTAENFSVSSDIINNVSNIATTSDPSDVENSDILKSIINMRHDKKMFTEGEPEDFMKALISNLGIDAQQAEVFSNNQSSVMDQIDKNRSSVSGVSLDEEMADMIKYQHAYNACAQMIATMQQIYDTLINKMGV